MAGLLAHMAIGAVEGGAEAAGRGWREQAAEARKQALFEKNRDEKRLHDKKVKDEQRIYDEKQEQDRRLWEEKNDRLNFERQHQDDYSRRQQAALLADINNDARAQLEYGLLNKRALLQNGRTTHLDENYQPTEDMSKARFVLNQKPEGFNAETGDISGWGKGTITPFKPTPKGLLSESEIEKLALTQGLKATAEQTKQELKALDDSSDSMTPEEYKTRRNEIFANEKERLAKNVQTARQGMIRSYGGSLVDDGGKKLKTVDDMEKGVKGETGKDEGEKNQASPESPAEKIIPLEDIPEEVRDLTSRIRQGNGFTKEELAAALPKLTPYDRMLANTRLREKAALSPHGLPGGAIGYDAIEPPQATDEQLLQRYLQTGRATKEQLRRIYPLLSPEEQENVKPFLGDTGGQVARR